MQCNTMEDFQRQIGLQLLKREDGSALLTGTINDRFHDIELTVEVAIATLSISAIRVELRRAPSPGCVNIAPRLQELVGMVIGPGMSRRLLAVLGGGSGCGNLRNLLQSLLPLVLNLSAAAGYDDEEEMLKAIHRRLRGSCVGYAEAPPD